MKKSGKLSFLLIAAFLYTLIFPINAIADENDTNKILSESTFESGEFENWSAFGGRSKVYLNHEKSHSGEYCLATSEREISWSGPTLNISDFIDPSAKLDFQAYVISEAPEGATIQISVKTIDSNGADDYISIAVADVSNTEWTLLEGTFECESNITEANVYFETLSGESDFCIDDVRIYGIEPPKNNKHNTDINYSFGFEDDLEGWVPRGAMTLSTTNKFSCKGRCSLYATDRTEVWNAPMVHLKRVMNGVDYKYSASVMYNGTDYEDSHIFQLKLQYIVDGVELYSKIADKTLQKGTWSNISGNFTLPENATDVFLYIQTDDVDTSDADVTENDLLSFYVDDVTVVDSTKANARKSAARAVGIIICIILAGLVIFVSVIIFRKTRSRRAALRSACIDAMTGAYNRNTFEEKMKSLEESADKTKRIFISVCDVNFLKYINDNYGHENGDKAIKRCASALLKSVGRKGSVYRVGGDEFVCICYADMTEEIKTELSIETGKYKGYPFAVAVGTAGYDKEADGNSPDVKAIFARADKEMYKNKQEIKKNNKDFTE